jgi:hypothetical protein
MPDNEPPPILSLHRYFLAAARMQRAYERVLSSSELEQKHQTMRTDLFAAYLHSGPASVLYYWYGALYVVKEGYDELGLSHPRVDALLKSTANVRALKRCRNGAFHFQKNYFDERFLELMYQPFFVQWVRDLTEAFRECIESQIAKEPWGNSFWGRAE